MKEILHIATECYPAAKAGGLGDVVGALPIYLPKHGINAQVVIPKYKNKWFAAQKWKTVYEDTLSLGTENIVFKVQKLQGGTINFPFYCIDIPGKFDRASVYLDVDGTGFKDEPARNISFQRSVLQWLSAAKIKFDGLHCHDHMTGLIPFFIKHCPAYKKLKNTPTFFTIHNGAYRGGFAWNEIIPILPEFEVAYSGLLDWDDHVNSLATAIKCAWAVNTVSPSYMKELMRDAGSLTPLYEQEKKKCQGILNGVDTALWNPATDPFLDGHLKGKKWAEFKKHHKTTLLKKYGLKSRRPLLGFIGRLATQKGADLLMTSLEMSINKGQKFSAIILGSGDKAIEDQLLALAKKYPDQIAVIVAYDEALARAIYAATDFLIMPSRFEPCGLNQLFAMRYGSIPIVSAVGGLLDTVPDIKKKGNGLVIAKLNTKEISSTVERAVQLFNNKKEFNALREKIVGLDYSWNKSAEIYAKLYHSF